MGTSTQRARKDGSIGYTAQIRLKQGGEVVFTEVQTFDRPQSTERRFERLVQLRTPQSELLAQPLDSEKERVENNRKSRENESPSKDRREVMATV
ncbi:hypothetical protein LMG32289_03981 [Cupriavidus pampae]|uniref:Uncharacterized protein n=1 Tax=Cupriavidus pampae TaxID=659251 RepID=A0ABN7YX36_9BURK|nr:hypothetical protein LMG32289_03981 [Cupriavidus pampae]